ncbi:MAG: rod shape-determining protein RodA [Krumholzibacteria bacterium]|nr:rod shape-determining protein RodA [Candidatus Krumholzibacteria bacterium]
MIGLLLPPGDKRIFLAWLLLCLASLAILWSVTEPIRGPYEQPDPGVAKSVFWRQAAFLLVSWFALLLASRLPLRYLEHSALPVYLVMVLLLVLVLVAGPHIGGAQRWLVLGPLRLQPAEPAKVALVLVLANVLGRSGVGGRSLPATVLSFLLMLVPMVLVLREPDLGTSLVFVAIWVGMVFWAGMPGLLLVGAASAVLSSVIMFYSESIARNPWPWGVYLLLVVGLLFLARIGVVAKVMLLAVNVATGIGIPVVWDRLQPYQQDRILTFFDPSQDEFGTAYQAIQSKVAIGSGGLFGTHYLQGTQKGLAFLPERHTDFIFSVVGEELGFFGAVAILFLFAVILLRGIVHAEAARKPFASFLAVGAVSYFTFHVVVNVAITTGLLPVTGLPLPLLSYGGSSLLASSVMLGLLLNVSSRTFDD